MYFSSVHVYINFKKMNDIVHSKKMIKEYPIFRVSLDSFAKLMSILRSSMCKITQNFVNGTVEHKTTNKNRTMIFPNIVFPQNYIPTFYQTFTDKSL